MKPVVPACRTGQVGRRGSTLQLRRSIVILHGGSDAAIHDSHKEGTMQDILTQVRDTLTVKRVFGEPIERDGVLIIPAAKVSGGGGGGSGPAEGADSGTGGGFGMQARPAGVFVIKNGEVTWEPAFDLNRVILGGQIVAIVLLLTIRAIARARARVQAAEQKHIADNP
jgi:uncharacterized spore protein YtfJ